MHKYSALFATYLKNAKDIRLFVSVFMILFVSTVYGNTETNVNNYSDESYQTGVFAKTPVCEANTNVKKRITKGGESGREVTFKYNSEGRISSQDGYKFVYTDSTIWYDEYDGIFILKDGLIAEYSDSYDHYTFEYNDGKLVSITETYIHYDTEDGYRNEYIGEITNYIEFTWDENVIVRQQEWFCPFDDEGLRPHVDYYYEYHDDEDYGGVCAFFQDNSLMFDDWPEGLIIQGYFGKLPKYLLKKATDDSDYGFGVTTFEWKLDSDGYPTKMTRTLKDGRKFSYYYTWYTYAGMDISLDESNEEIDVYNINGIMLERSLTIEQLNQLKPGVYIIHCGDKVYKSIIK